MLIETVGVLTAALLVAAASRVVADARRYAGILADELRFHPRDRRELKTRFARVIGERAPFE